MRWILFALSRNDERRDASFDRAGAEPALQRLRHGLGRSAKPWRAPSLDLTANRRALSKTRRDIKCGFGPGTLLDTLDLRPRETARHEIQLYGSDVVIAMRRALDEAGRVGRKDLGQRIEQHPGEFVAGDRIPDIEKIMAAGPKDPSDLAVAFRLVGEEHHAELAGRDIETPVGERQIHRVGLLPSDVDVSGRMGSGKIEHGLVEVCRDNARALETRRQRARERPCSRRELENLGRPQRRDATGQILGIGAKDQWDEQPL